jgi:hypothetical protein
MAMKRISMAKMIVWTLLTLVTVWGKILFADEDSTILFSWAFVYQGSDEITKAIDYTKSIVRLESGDKIKIYFKPLNVCYIYLYLYDSQKDLFILFPENFNFWERHYQINKRYNLPEGNNWFYLDDNSGIEVFYLVVSEYRLQSLEATTSKYLEQNLKHRNYKNVTYKYGVLDEIKKMIKESSYLTDVVEKPIAVAGDFRGIRDENECNGINVETKNIYVKTIRLEH